MNTEIINEISVHTDSCIKGFFNDYRWLSNFHLIPITYKGLEYPSTENAYQAAKTDDEYLKKTMQTISPSKSQKLGQEIKKRKDWESIKVDVMREVLSLKFKDPQLKKLLIETGNKHLEETNYWNDTFWGVYNGKGKSMLGNLLMEIRDQLANE